MGGGEGEHYDTFLDLLRVLLLLGSMRDNG